MQCVNPPRTCGDSAIDIMAGAKTERHLLNAFDGMRESSDLEGEVRFEWKVETSDSGSECEEFFEKVL